MMSLPRSNFKEVEGDTKTGNGSMIRSNVRVEQKCDVINEEQEARGRELDNEISDIDRRQAELRKMITDKQKKKDQIYEKPIKELLQLPELQRINDKFEQIFTQTDLVLSMIDGRVQNLLFPHSTQEIHEQLKKYAQDRTQQEVLDDMAKLLHELSFLSQHTSSQMEQVQIEMDLIEDSIQSNGFTLENSSLLRRSSMSSSSSSQIEINIIKKIELLSKIFEQFDLNISQIFDAASDPVQVNAMTIKQNLSYLRSDATSNCFRASTLGSYLRRNKDSSMVSHQAVFEVIKDQLQKQLVNIQTTLDKQELKLLEQAIRQQQTSSVIDGVGFDLDQFSIGEGDNEVSKNPSNKQMEPINEDFHLLNFLEFKRTNSNQESNLIEGQKRSCIKESSDLRSDPSILFKRSLKESTESGSFISEKRKKVVNLDLDDVESDSSAEEEIQIKSKLNIASLPTKSILRVKSGINSELREKKSESTFPIKKDILLSRIQKQLQPLLEPHNIRHRQILFTTLSNSRSHKPIIPITGIACLQYENLQHDTNQLQQKKTSPSVATTKEGSSQHNEKKNIIQPTPISRELPPKIAPQQTQSSLFEGEKNKLLPTENQKKEGLNARIDPSANISKINLRYGQNSQDIRTDTRSEESEEYQDKKKKEQAVEQVKAGTNVGIMTSKEPLDQANASKNKMDEQKLQLNAQPINQTDVSQLFGQLFSKKDEKVQKIDLPSQIKPQQFSLTLKPNVPLQDSETKKEQTQEGGKSNYQSLKPIDNNPIKENKNTSQQSLVSRDSSGFGSNLFDNTPTPSPGDFNQLPGVMGVYNASSAEASKPKTSVAQPSATVDPSKSQTSINNSQEIVGIKVGATEQPQKSLINQSTGGQLGAKLDFPEPAKPQTNESTGGLFGAKSQAGESKGGLFGVLPQAGELKGGLFGTQPQAGELKGGLFGTLPQAGESTGGMFGALAQAGESTWGMFGAKPQAGGSTVGLFGAKPVAPEPAKSVQNESIGGLPLAPQGSEELTPQFVKKIVNNNQTIGNKDVKGGMIPKQENLADINKVFANLSMDNKIGGQSVALQGGNTNVFSGLGNTQSKGMFSLSTSTTDNNNNYNDDQGDNETYSMNAGEKRRKPSIKQKDSSQMIGVSSNSQVMPQNKTPLFQGTQNMTGQPSMFGQQVQNPSTQPPSSLEAFGFQKQTLSAPGGSLFGQPQNSNQGLFDTQKQPFSNIFQTSNQNASIFGFPAPSNQTQLLQQNATSNSNNNQLQNPPPTNNPMEMGKQFGSSSFGNAPSQQPFGFKQDLHNLTFGMSSNQPQNSSANMFLGTIQNEGVGSFLQNAKTFTLPQIDTKGPPMNQPRK